MDKKVTTTGSFGESITKGRTGGGSPSGPGYTALVIYLQYDPAKYKASVKEFTSLFRDCKNGSFTFLIVDNKRETEFEEMVSEHTVMVNGDNRGHEFTGWYRGINYALQHLSTYDLVIFANDTYPLNLHEILPIINDKILTALVSAGVSGGLIYAENQYKGWARYFTHKLEHYVLDGQVCNHWVRSNFFMVPYCIMAKINWPMLNPDVYFCQQYRGDAFRGDAPVSARLQKKILSYLCPSGQVTSEKFVWHSHFHLSESTYGFFRQKATCILNEMRLAREIEAAGAQIIDLRVVRCFSHFGPVAPFLMAKYQALISRSPNIQANVIYLFDRVQRRIDAIIHVPRARAAIRSRGHRTAIT